MYIYYRGAAIKLFNTEYPKLCNFDLYSEPPFAQ